MAELYQENAQCFTVPTELSSTDKLKGLVKGEKADAIHALMQAVINALTKIEPVFIGPDKVGIVNDTDTSALVEASNVLSLDVTGSATKTQKYIATIPLNGVANKGAKLTGFTMYYTVATADLNSAPVVSLNKKTMAAPPTGATVAITGTTNKVKGDYAIAFTVDTPAELGNADYIDILMSFETANTAVLKFYGLVLDFE